MGEFNVQYSKENFIENCKLFFEENVPSYTILSNLSRLIYNTFNGTSWSGFYLMENDILYLGPFQGEIACTKIPIGKGVCGTSAFLQETQLVPNVHEYPGHIACSSSTNSEIVVPIIKDKQVLGVIDLDSDEFNNYTLQDKLLLETLANLLKDRI